VGQFRLKDSPDSPVGVGVQAVKRKQVRRITISIGDVIAASLIVATATFATALS
jgi:hypothetical protein